jgi:hypothetical protein
MFQTAMALRLAEVVAGVEDFFGQDPLVALGFVVVARGERFGLLVLGAVADDSGEVPRAVAGAVLGDHPVDVGDPVGGEPGLGPCQEPGGGGAPLVVERLGIGQPGEPATIECRYT